MNSSLKTVLVLATFAIVTVVLFTPCQEHFVNDNIQSNRNIIDPRHHPYSKNIHFRPDNADTIASDHESHKIYDHIDDNNHLNYMDGQHDEVTKNNVDVDTNKKRVRFEVKHDVFAEPEMSPSVKSVNKQILFNRANGLDGYCFHSELVANNKHVRSNVFRDHHDIDTDINNDMTGKSHCDMMMHRPTMKTHIEIDSNVGKYNQKQGKGNQPISKIEDLTTIIGMYRNDALDSIHGGYRDHTTFYKNPK